MHCVLTFVILNGQLIMEKFGKNIHDVIIPILPSISGEVRKKHPRRHNSHFTKHFHYKLPVQDAQFPLICLILHFQCISFDYCMKTHWNQSCAFFSWKIKNTLLKSRIHVYARYLTNKSGNNDWVKVHFLSKIKAKICQNVWKSKRKDAYWKVTKKVQIHGVSEC